MIASGEWLTPTRAVGIAAYGIAVTCCGIAWARTGSEHTVSRIAAWLTAIEGILLLDMIFNARWILHQLLLDFARRWHEYELRRLPQVIVVAMLIGILLIGFFSALRLFRARIGALLAVSGALLSLVTWCIEVVSLHQIDAALYHPIGKSMAVSLLWIAACTMVSVGILIESRPANVAQLANGSAHRNQGKD
jgi:hypothetical protein